MSDLDGALGEGPVETVRGVVLDVVGENGLKVRRAGGGGGAIVEYDVTMAVTVDEPGERAGAVSEEVARSGHRTVVTDHGRPVAAIAPIAGAYEPDAILDFIGGYGALADLVPPGRSGVEELLAERREEAARETST